MSNHYSITYDTTSSTEFVDFLADNAVLFSPSFDGGGLGIKAYAKKIKNYGHTIEYRNEDSKLSAILAYYRNDTESFLYITYICVCKTCQRQGIASLLFKQLAILNQNDLFEWRLEVNKSNIAALNLYSRRGFISIEDRGEKWLMVKNWH